MYRASCPGLLLSLWTPPYGVPVGSQSVTRSKRSDANEHRRQPRNRSARKKKSTLTLVQRIEYGHLLCRELEVIDPQILLDPRLGRGLRDRDEALARCRCQRQGRSRTCTYTRAGKLGGASGAACRQQLDRQLMSACLGGQPRARICIDPPDGPARARETVEKVPGKGRPGWTGRRVGEEGPDRDRRTHLLKRVAQQDLCGCPGVFLRERGDRGVAEAHPADERAPRLCARAGAELGGVGTR